MQIPSLKRLGMFYFILNPLWRIFTYTFREAENITAVTGIRAP
jgi:hypothetical protein